MIYFAVIIIILLFFFDCDVLQEIGFLIHYFILPWITSRNYFIAIWISVSPEKTLRIAKWLTSYFFDQFELYPKTYLLLSQLNNFKASIPISNWVLRNISHGVYRKLSLKAKFSSLYGAPFSQKLITFMHTNFNFCTTSKYFLCDTNLFNTAQYLFICNMFSCSVQY